MAASKSTEANFGVCLTLFVVILALHAIITFPLANLIQDLLRLNIYNLQLIPDYAALPLTYILLVYLWLKLGNYQSKSRFIVALILLLLITPLANAAYLFVQMVIHGGG